MGVGGGGGGGVRAWVATFGIEYLFSFFLLILCVQEGENKGEGAWCCERPARQRLREVISRHGNWGSKRF